MPHAGRVDPVRREKEQAALHAILASRVFETKPRLASLLNYICERYFEGDIDAIKEYSIATDVFRRPQSFDQATDSIVRVEVFRLRKKLREFYDGEGADQTIEIVVATGHYRPQFLDRIPQTRLVNPTPESELTALPAKSNHGVEAELPGWTPEKEQYPPEDYDHPVETLPAKMRPLGWRIILAAIAIFASAAVVTVTIWHHAGPLHASANGAPPALSTSSTAAGPEIRIRCGYSRPIYKDEEGNLWSGDHFFSGGVATELRDQHIARTRNPELYLTARTGVFSYKIPLPPGTYEMHLHFAETTYSPASSLGGGENSRVFDVQLNGRPLLTQFDIVSDAGANTADVRVFRDIAPEQDGYLHLDFTGTLGLPIINAIEIVPGLPHRLRPIRMVAQNSFFVDKAGNLWMPDSYFSSGQLAADKVVIDDTPEPGLFAGERYGNFAYAIPVDEGSYRITLFFSEKYWGTEVSKKGGVGSRVFDVFCNGVALARRLDVLKEAGPARALVKSYHGQRPNAQGKLIVSFVPDANYATVDAVEVEEEAP